MKYRIENDTMGAVQVPEDKYWGAQTQRSFNNFKIGGKMPIEVIHAYAVLKKSCALANAKFEKLPADKAILIENVCNEILNNKHNEQFPLVIFQTGSGTQTNMNLNEVIANRGHVNNGGSLSDEIKYIHPNDDVNKSQSSNDTFPTAMNIAAMLLLKNNTIPALKNLKIQLENKSLEFRDIIKTGRTHMMDATPISFGQEFSAYVAQLDKGISAIEKTFPHLSELAIGGTAVGTGLNAPKGFDKMVCDFISEFSGSDFIPAVNKFASLSAHDAIVESHGALKQVVVSLMKISNDFRLMASGPRCGFGEITLPANEPGSSIMPGKVNPTQIEALNMVCAKVIGNDMSIAIAGMGGQFELNTYKPILIADFIESASLLSEAVDSFNKNCVVGITVNEDIVNENLSRSLMLVTALNETIGYENSAKIAKYAYSEGVSLRESAIKLGLVKAEDFDEIVNPKNLI